MTKELTVEDRNDLQEIADDPWTYGAHISSIVAEALDVLESKQSQLTLADKLAEELEDAMQADIWNRAWVAKGGPLPNAYATDLKKCLKAYKESRK